MKKTMTMSAKLTCLFFLILGLGGGMNVLQAQTQISETAVVPQFLINANGDTKLPFTIMGEAAAHQTIRTELQTNYSGALPDQNTLANATIVFKVRFLTLVNQQLEKGISTANAVNSAHEKLVSLTADTWPGLVNEDWRQDMFTLLSL